MDSIRDYGFFMDIKGGSRHPAYTTWKSIATRCYIKAHKSYDSYGGSGVTVCEEWKKFSNFKKWFDENYIDGYQIDKDICGLNEYSPDGCLFVSAKENILESQKRRDYSYLKRKTGKLNHRSKPVEYYGEYPSTKSDFRLICKRQGWSIDDFEEIGANIKIGKNKKYYYKIKK